MKKTIVVLGIALAFFVTSCASNHPAVPRPFEGSSKIFKVSSNGTVKVKGINSKDQSMNWIFVRCIHWSGCYLLCQGPVITCKSIARNMGLKITHIITR